MKVDKRVWRLLDANLNRAREGMRVVEDTLRFVLNRPHIYREVRNLRHKLDQTAFSVYSSLIAYRDSLRDEGRCVLEDRRKSLKDLLVANFRRSQEALRVLEEYGRLFSRRAKFKEIRFQLYDIEKRTLRNYYGAQEHKSTRTQAVKK